MALPVVTEDMIVNSDGRAKKEKYTCPSCRHILRHAVQPSCGHWLCKPCAEEFFTSADESGNVPFCLKEGCEERLTKEDGAYFFPDHFVRKDILKMVIGCRHRSRGCNWEGKYGDLKVHLDSCKYHKFICSLCDKQLSENEEETHECVCPKAVRDCPLACLGCTVKDKMTRTEVREHILDNVVNHFDMLARAVKLVEKNNLQPPPESLRKQLYKTSELDPAFAFESPDLPHRMGDFVEADGGSPVGEEKEQKKGRRVEAEGGEFIEKKGNVGSSGGEKKGRRRGRRVVADGSEFVEKGDSELVAESKKKGEGIVPKKESVLNLRLVSEAQDVASDRVFSQAVRQNVTDKVLTEKLGVLRQDMVTLMRSEVKSQSDEIASVRALTTKVERNMRSKNAELEDTNFRLSLLENCNHDGTMIWKIPQISQRMSDAENGKYTSIFSLPFYTGRYGYKMCMRLYILGDGIGKGTHMSLFFVLMKGEFDNILQWPFTHKVTFKLINQAGGVDVFDTFQPDPMSSSFRKPRSDMNIASGCPRFIPLQDLKSNGFIVDDTIFIKCIVDIANIRHP